jgi:hypothetical protein
LVDRNARDELGRAIRRLAAGLVTNDQFEDGLSPGVWRSRDVGVRSIQRAAWHLYDDLHEHRLEGSYRPGRHVRREIARWVLFLRSEQEYAWPDLTGWTWFLLAVPNVVTFGGIGWLVRRWHDRRGDAEVWPFSRAQDLQAAALCWPRRAPSDADVT